MKRSQIILIIMLIIVFSSAMFIALDPQKPRQGHDWREANLADEAGFNESSSMAEFRVRESYQYQNYNASNLRLTGVQQDRTCGNCWEFTYMFDVTSPPAPQGVDAMEMSVHVVNGILQDTVMTEIGR